MSDANMDDQLQQMEWFTNELMRFNERLATSMNDLETQHEYVSPLWQDTMRLSYNREWEPLGQIMRGYLDREARDYVEFLHIKMHALRGYLYGNG